MIVSLRMLPRSLNEEVGTRLIRGGKPPNERRVLDVRASLSAITPSHGGRIRVELQGLFWFARHPHTIHHMAPRKLSKPARPFPVSSGDIDEMAAVHPRKTAPSLGPGWGRGDRSGRYPAVAICGNSDTPKRTPWRFHDGAVDAERARRLANGSPLRQPPASA